MALLSGGGQAQFVTVPEGLLMPIPKDMTFIQAAAIPEAWLTAFQLLHFVGEQHLPIYPIKTAHLPFCYKILSLLPPFECYLPSKNLFSVTLLLWVGTQYARHKSLNLDHLSPVPAYKEGYGKMVRMLFICIS